MSRNAPRQNASKLLTTSQELKNGESSECLKDFELNICHVFVWGNNYDSYRFFITLKQIRGLASYFELCFWSKKKYIKSIFVLFKNYRDFFSIPACKLVHCACVSVDCLVISFYLHSFVVRDLADSFFFFFYILY